MNGGAVTIRPSRDEDVAAITAIYGYHVLNGVSSFEEVPPSEAEIARRRGDILARGLPYLVAVDAAESAGRVVGYCYAGPYRARSAYRFAVEDSIYVAADEVGRGVGRTLLRAVLEQCTALGYRQMVAVIGGNETMASIRLHEALGFTHIGVFTAVGFKFGRWVDTVLMQIPLGPGASAPPA